MGGKHDQLLNIDKDSYTKQFSRLELGADLAAEIAATHGYTDDLVRIPEGSSLVFKMGSDHFIKLTPPFFEDSIEAELLAAKVIGNQLSIPTPKLVADGRIGTWKYLVCQAIPGEQAKNVFGKMDATNRAVFAADIGAAVREIHEIHSEGFERKFGPWDKYLENRLKNQKSIHLERGNTEELADKIQSFVLKYAENLRALGPTKMIHADLNHEHLLLTQQDNLWRLSGIIDFADAMNAPIEMDLILPILCFFRGNVEFQRKLFESAKIVPKFSGNHHSNLMMALALQNRFIAFHDWFDRELQRGASTIEEIAASCFPAF